MNNDIRYYNVITHNNVNKKQWSCFFSWVWKLVCHIMGRPQTVAVEHQGAEVNIWVQEM
jgi:hypothetical protein